MGMENLKALVYGRELTMYQRSLARREFEAIIIENKLLKFMVDNGLGEDDMKNDITLPNEI